MGKIGNFGSKIRFETSDDRILTFNDFQKNVSNRWASHEIINQKPKLQFLGPDSTEVTFTVVLSAELGVSPKDTLKKIEKYVTNGNVEKLVIGNQKIGSFVIEKMSESWDTVFSKGELVKATIDLTLREYA
ncbi:MAG: phage tail protein [Bacteroidales bacterium]|nr:phage tail protein [Bacteroidales bacterium]